MTTSSAPTISRFPVAELADAPEDLRTFVQDVADKTGFVPNIFLALLHRPEECRAFIAYYTAVMDRRGGLTHAEKEMIIVATSAAWDCPYCGWPPPAVLPRRAKPRVAAHSLPTNSRPAAMTDRQRAMLDY